MLGVRSLHLAPRRVWVRRPDVARRLLFCRGAGAVSFDGGILMLDPEGNEFCVCDGGESSG